MRTYEPDEPLIFIHIPKTAGASTRCVVQQWFGDRLSLHYYNEKSGKPPERRILAERGKEPRIVYGHFNSLRGFGVQDYYPEVRQFITMLREPFEMAVSGYFYVRKAGADWKDPSRVPRESLADYLENHTLNMLNHFPDKITLDNYQEVIESKFVSIGITEHLAESLRHIAEKVGKRFDPASLPRLNATARDHSANDESLRERFVKQHPLEYAVYQYALGRLAK